MQKIPDAKIKTAFRTIFFWSVRFVAGFPIIYGKLPLIDVQVDALANMGWIPMNWTEYDRHMGSWFQFFKFSAAEMSYENNFMKLFEQLGEAIPQLSLALTYYLNNQKYIWSTEPPTLGYLPVPSTLLSIIFSSGSILMGIFTGIKAYKQVSIKALDEEGLPFLHAAVRFGNKDDVLNLIKKGFNVNVRDISGATAIMQASYLDMTRYRLRAT